MLDQILDSPSFNYMQRGMEAANLRQEVISNNIANVNTPNFKRSDVVFETLLAKELGMDEDKNKLKMVRTRDKHLPQAMSSKAKLRLHTNPRLMVAPASLCSPRPTNELIRGVMP